MSAGSEDLELEDDQERDEAWEIASSATSYQLSYRRSPTRRVFALYELTGPDIDDAHHRGQRASGTWRDYAGPGPQPWDDASAGVEAWTTKYLRMALQEAVHECLEWLRIHGQPWLNPHSHRHDDAVREAVDVLFNTLAQLRPDAGTATPSITDPDAAPASTAAGRVEFQLSYRRSPERRSFTRGLLTGPDIDNAYRDQPMIGLFQDPLDHASGQWDDEAPALDGDDNHTRATAADWQRKYIGMALQEAVHECLEWLILDDHRWLDPHGPRERAIQYAVDQLNIDLHQHRAGTPVDMTSGRPAARACAKPAAIPDRTPRVEP